MPDYDSYRILAGRIRMHIMNWPGEDPPALFLHGFTANGLAALPLGQLLGGRRRLIAPDLRGRGESDMPFGDYGLQNHLKDLMACLDRMELDTVSVIGHSFGAMLGLLMAANFPRRIDRLILVDGGGIPSPAAVSFLNAYYDSIPYRYPTAEDYIDRYRQSALFQPFTPELERLLRSNLFKQPDGTFIRKVARYVVEAERLPEHLEFLQTFAELYPRVQCPVLILRAEYGLSGADDLELPDEAVQAMLKGLREAQVVTVEGVGHTSILTSPHQKRDLAILKFLNVEP